MFRTTILILILVLTAGTVFAQASKQLSAGVGAYVITVSDGDERDNLEGYAFTGMATLGPGSAVRGHLYFTKPEDEDDSSKTTTYKTELNGYDIQFLLGSNIRAEGFKIYALGGYWSETYEIKAETSKTTTGELDFSGFMAGLGIGYNWTSATLDFWVAWRDLGDYEDLFNAAGTKDITMGAGALSFGLRF